MLRYKTIRKMIGNVARLREVLINVALDTNSGSVLNCSAYIVVFAAVGIAAIIIIICFTISSTGSRSVSI